MLCPLPSAISGVTTSIADTTLPPTHAASSQAILAFVTDFADQAVVLPVAVSVLAALAVLGWRRAALAWAACIGGTLGATLFLKLAVMACGLGGGFGLVSPSGHTASAAAIYGGALSLLVPAVRRGALIAAAGAAAIALAIGTTRLALGVHSLADVSVGAAIGVPGAVCMRILAGRRPTGLPLPRLAIAALAIMLLFHGRQLNAEPRLRWAAAQIWPLTLCRGHMQATVEGAR